MPTDTPTPDPVVQAVLLNLADSFHQLDDAGDLPFGEYARVEWVRGDDRMLVMHEEPGKPAVEITVRRRA